MEELLKCPVCNEGEFMPFLKCIDYTVTKEAFQIVSCSKCSFKFTNPRPSKDSIGRYYESDDYVSHSNTRKGLINKIYHLVKKRAINHKIELIEGLGCKNKALMDIGCGTGSFLGVIKQSGWKVCGIEPNSKARNIAITDHGIEVHDETGIIGLKIESFSIITMWHVLEHVHDLRIRISEIKNLLEKNGYAIIAVPNHFSCDAKHYKEFWAAYDVPRHLYHFSPETIKKVFTDFGMKHIRSYPMKMDSFYVSMLSEKYKGSSLSLIKAFLNGLKSNFAAKNDAEKYSSVIYVFQKN